MSSNLAICLPHRDNVSGIAYNRIANALIWATDYWRRTYPTGQIAVFGVQRGHAGRSRNEITNDVLGHPAGFDWTFWLDDDAVPPPDILERLHSHGKDMVTPIFRKRRHPYECPAVIRENGVSRLPDLDLDTLCRISWNGMHCALIHTDVLRRVRKSLGAPPEGKEHPNCWQMTDEISEDVFFFQVCGRVGFDLWLDRGCVVDHVVTSTVERMREMQS